jgi:hypothetical protein
MKSLRNVCLFLVLLLDVASLEKLYRQVAPFNRVWSTIHERHWQKAFETRVIVRGIASWHWGR